MLELRSWRKAGEWVFENAGRVVDLDIPEKISILGSGGVKEDLKTAIEELGLNEVPSVFICSIMLDTMLDPVTLCSGQTYERSSILKWFSMGRFTCPTTMQDLWDDSVVPNTTLHQFIYTCFSDKHQKMKRRSEEFHGRMVELLETLKKSKGRARVQALKELHKLLVASFSAKNSFVNGDGIQVVSSLLGPFTSYAVGSEVIAILVNSPLDCENRGDMLQPSKFSLVVDMLHERSTVTKINCIQLIQKLMDVADFDPEIISSLRLLVGLVKLRKDKRCPNGIGAGISLLKAICSKRR